MPNAKTLVIIDDHPLFREGLKAIFRKVPRYQLIGEAGTAAEGLRLIRSLAPDLILVDISLPDKSGIELSREIRRLKSRFTILVISMHAGVNYISEAFRAGAMGYVLKESVHKRLLQGMDTVSAGEYYLDSFIPPEIAEKLFSQTACGEETGDMAYGRLTAREQTVMRLLAEGFNYVEIGDMLYISPETVEKHHSDIMRILGLCAMDELVRYAARIGLIDVDF